jgi:quinolinate synthase
MAESADILTDERVRVILPDMGAGCSMADMANLDQTLECWAQLQEACPDQTIVPITYMNSSAAIKAFVGEHGGAVCTSSNCRNVLEWALPGGRVEGHTPGRKVKILFFPDQHLGRNTAYAMGYPLDRMVVWDPAKDLGGNDDAACATPTSSCGRATARCHACSAPEHVDEVRAKHPDMKVIVHPECKWEVVQKADMAGSTAYIVKQVEAAPRAAEWAIGTEVTSSTAEAAAPRPEDRRAERLPVPVYDMFRIDLPHLCWVLENLVDGTW